jgi:membrane associated rhomboid family serine protease
VKALRKLVLGETVILPVGVFATLAIGLVLEAIADSAAWWRHAGGFILLALVLVVLAVALPRRR